MREELYAAVRDLDVEKVEKMIHDGSGFAVNELNEALLILFGKERICCGEWRREKRRIPEIDNIAALLLEAGAKVCCRDSNGLSPLHLASEVYPYNLGVLLEAGADPNEAAPGGWRALMKTPFSPSEDLLNAGADPNAATYKGETAMHYCVSTKKAELLLAYGAKLDARDSLGRTPLMTAAASSRPFMVKWLSREPELLGERDLEGNDALHYARQGGDERIIAYLLKAIEGL